jgi:glycosyltransferase involved in cell wall biosynthesis
MGSPAPLRVHALVDSLTCGGAELLLAELGAAAPAAGIDLSVGYLQERDGNPGVERLREVGIEPVLVGIPGHLYPSALTRVRRHLAGIRPDVVHTHLGNADLLGGVAARSLRMPALSTIHASDWRTAGDDGAADYVKTRLMALARRRCTARVIAVSEGARRSYIEGGWDVPEHVVTVYNGLARAQQPGAGRAVRAELGVDEGDLLVVTVSALRPEKAHDVTLAAIAALRERFPSLRLVIVGDGPARAEVERAAAPLGDAVVFAGYRSDVMAVLDAADVLVNPSRTDAFPTALLEAMAAGVPVVATDVGGMPEIVDQGQTGVLIEAPPHPRRLAEALVPLLDDRDLRLALGERARQRFSERFAADRWAERLHAVYEDVVANGSAGG